MGNTTEKYKAIFSDYIIKTLGLEQIDKALAENSMGFISVPEEEKTDYQKDSPLGLKFIYLRNEFHIDRLSDEELQNFEAGDEFAEKTVLETFERVISKNEINSDEDRKVITFYDQSIAPDFVNANALVLVIGTYPEYDENDNFKNLEHETEKDNEAKLIAEKLEQSFRGKLGIVPIRVLVDA